MKPIERFEPGQIIYTPGCSPLILIAPYCPIWQRCNEPAWNKAGKAIKPDGLWCYQWRSHKKRQWRTSERVRKDYRRWLKLPRIDGWRSRRLPVHTLLPCWVVSPYKGGSAESYLRQGIGTPTILRWAGKLKPFKLHYEIQSDVAEQKQRNKQFKLALLMRGKRYRRRDGDTTTRRFANTNIKDRSANRAIAQGISAGRNPNASTSKRYPPIPEAC